MAILFTHTQLSFAQTAPVGPSQDKHIEKVRKQVEKIGVGGQITVVRPNGKQVFGSVTNIEPDGFAVSDVDKQLIVDLKYPDVKKVYKGQGEKNVFTGKRNNPQHGWLYAGAILGTLFVVLGVALSHDK